MRTCVGHFGMGFGLFGEVEFHKPIAPCDNIGSHILKNVAQGSGLGLQGRWVDLQSSATAFDELDSRFGIQFPTDREPGKAQAQNHPGT